jgi:hypothetical protein
MGCAVLKWRRNMPRDCDHPWLSVELSYRSADRAPTVPDVAVGDGGRRAARHVPRRWKVDYGGR